GIRLFRGMSALENVMVGLYPRHAAPVWECLLHTPYERREEDVTASTALHWLGFVGLAAKADVLPDQLSYAHQRRVELARALASDPRLLLLDEPAAGMNPTEKADLMRLVRKIQSSGVTVVLIDHDMSLVMSISDRVSVLDRGQLIADGTPAEIQVN